MPGCFSLVLNVRFRNSCQHIKLALASTTMFHMSFLLSALTIDIEPSSAQEVTLFCKVSEQTYSDLHTKLVVPKYHPQQGGISHQKPASTYSLLSLKSKLTHLKQSAWAHLREKSDQNDYSQNRPDLTVFLIRLHPPQTCSNALSAAASCIRSAVSTAWNSSDLTTRVQRNIPVNLNNRVCEGIRKNICIC